MRPLFGLRGLDEYNKFFRTLRQLPYPIVHRFLVELREHEISSGEGDRWVSQHASQLGLLAMATGEDELPTVQEAYIRYRLLRRPIAFCMLALYGEGTSFLSECVTIDGREVIERTPEAIFVATHFGPQSAIPFLIAALDREVTTVMAQTERDLIWGLLSAYCPEAASRISLIGVPDRSVLKKCLTTLRGGGSLVIFMEFSESNFPCRVSASFFDLLMPAPEGPFLLAAVSGRPIVPVRVLHSDDLRMRLIFDEPIYIPRLRRRELDKVVQPMWNRLEACVRTNPDQWLGWEMLARRCKDSRLERSDRVERSA